MKLFKNKDLNKKEKIEKIGDGYLITSKVVYSSPIINPICKYYSWNTTYKDNIEKTFELLDETYPLYLNNIIIFLYFEFDLSKAQINSSLNMELKDILDIQNSISSNSNLRIVPYRMIKDFIEYNTIYISGSIESYKELINNVHCHNRFLQSIVTSLASVTYKKLFTKQLYYRIIKDELFIDDNIKFNMPDNIDKEKKNFDPQNKYQIFFVDNFNYVKKCIIDTCNEFYTNYKSETIIINDYDLESITGLCSNNGFLSYKKIFYTYNKDHDSNKSINDYIKEYGEEFGVPEYDKYVGVPYYLHNNLEDYSNIDEVLEESVEEIK